MTDPKPALRATVKLPGGAATDVWVPNLPEHEDALRRLVDAIGHGATIETAEWPQG